MSQQRRSIYEDGIAPVEGCPCQDCRAHSAAEAGAMAAEFRTHRDASEAAKVRYRESGEKIARLRAEQDAAARDYWSHRGEAAAALLPAPDFGIPTPY